ncbi:MAG: hypothetical protein ACLQVN_24205, partial [Bryobacteraceae bacterium]
MPKAKRKKRVSLNLHLFMELKREQSALPPFRLFPSLAAGGPATSIGDRIAAPFPLRKKRVSLNLHLFMELKREQSALPPFRLFPSLAAGGPAT